MLDLLWLTKSFRYCDIEKPPVILYALLDSLRVVSKARSACTTCSNLLQSRRRTFWAPFYLVKRK